MVVQMFAIEDPFDHRQHLNICFRHVKIDADHSFDFPAVLGMFSLLMARNMIASPLWARMIRSSDLDDCYVIIVMKQNCHFILVFSSNSCKLEWLNHPLRMQGVSVLLIPD
ncbi:hypothetical protein LIER_38787 [Lithospermum erythrorhizon]|uniref:Uncharacterized protein n=1 Tax=Lithospermum erythrorhizon TaxID=34254 RepID=A0AAV3Q569_LITER